MEKQKTRNTRRQCFVRCCSFQRVFLQFKKCHFWWESQKGWFKISYRIPLLHHHVPILQFPLMVGKNRCNFQTSHKIVTVVSHGFPWFPMSPERCSLWPWWLRGAPHGIRGHTPKGFGGGPKASRAGGWKLYGPGHVGPVMGNLMIDPAWLRQRMPD